MSEYSEELEISNLKKYAIALMENTNSPIEKLGVSADFLEKINCRRKLMIVVQRLKVERELVPFIHEASRVRWRVEEFKRRLTNEFYRLVRKHFGVYDTPSNCSLCDEHCFAERSCITLSQELNLYGCLQHASIHECVPKVKKVGNQKFNVHDECPCTATSAETYTFCVFSGRIDGIHLLETCSTSKDFSSDDATVRSKAGFNFRQSKIEFDAIQDIYRNKDSVAVKTHSLRLKRKLDTVQQKPLPSTANEFPPEFSKSAEQVQEIPELVENTSANSSQEIVNSSESLHSAKKHQTVNSNAASAAQEQEKREFLNNNSYFQYKKEGIIQEAERYLRGFAESIMLDLLYDKEARQLINEEQIFRVSSEMTASLNAYHSSQKRAKEMPNYVTCLAAFLTPQSKLKLLRLVEYDRFQIEMFCGRAVDLWKLCFRSPAYFLKKVEMCTFKKFVVALLFCMKTGLSIPVRGLAWAETEAVDKIQIVKHEPTFEQDVPDENQIRLFGKQGKDHIRKILQSGGVATATTAVPSTSRDASEERQRPRVTHIDTIPQRIQVDGIGTVMCKSFLPDYLQEEIIGDTYSYASSDVACGMSFFKDCVASFSEDNRRLLAFV